MSLAAFPVGSRVRVLPCPEWADPEAVALVGVLGTVIGHDDPYVLVTLDGHDAPYGDEGWLFEVSEVDLAP